VNLETSNGRYKIVCPPGAYLQANLESAWFSEPLDYRPLGILLENADEARQLTGGSIGAGFHATLAAAGTAHCIGSDLSGAGAVTAEGFLERLVLADLFRARVLPGALPGHQRFSLGGQHVAHSECWTRCWTWSRLHGATECVMAMSHRGRLNLMVHTAFEQVQAPPTLIIRRVGQQK